MDGTSNPLYQNSTDDDRKRLRQLNNKLAKWISYVEVQRKNRSEVNHSFDLSNEEYFERDSIQRKIWSG